MEDDILYDIKRYSVWTNETDLNKDINAQIRQKNLQKNYYYLNKIGSYLKSFIKSDHSTFKLLLSSIKPWNQWKLAISKNGLLAILQDNFIEVYSNDDSFSDYIWRKEAKTNCSQLCSLCWNKASNLLILVNEYANYFLFDDHGKELSQYAETETLAFENALNRVFFTSLNYFGDLSASDGIIEVFVSVSYLGYVYIYGINKDFKISKLTCISVSNIFPNGVYCSEIDSESNYLLLASFSKDSFNKKTKTCSKNGISVWRFINSKPWLKNVFLTDELKEISRQEKNIDKLEYVTKLSISPDNSTLASIYNNGKIALYSMPNLKLINSWILDEQSADGEIENPFEAKMFNKIYSKIDTKAFDVGWWNKKVLIISRGTGALTLCSSDDLSNLMGQHQEWLSPYANLHSYQNLGFLVLDCACTLLKSQSLSNDSGDEQNLDSENETLGDDFDEDKWFDSITQLTKSKLYNLSGIERLKPVEKKPKFLKRKFKLLHFLPTTPEELFQSKLNGEEYGEALQLAKRYDLDTDLVYQKQWRSKTMNKSSINDYLSKIKKRSWILHECIERVPDQIDSAKYLIEFGLRGTDIDALIAISEKDDNRYLYCHNVLPDDVDFESVDRFNPKEIQEQNEKLKKFKLDKLKKLNLNNLNLMQKELCLTRIKLLTYADRLTVYEQILGGKSLAAGKFEAEIFYKLRSQSVLDMAIDYAREGNSKAVQTIISFYQNELKDKSLEILNNFSETIDPYEYEILLPVIKDNSVELYDSEEYLRDEKDWVELDEIQKSLDLKNENLNDKTTLTSAQVEKWYENRINEIEAFSGFVDNSEKLCQLAIRNGCRKKLTKLYDNLLTLSTLIYECKTDNKLITLSYIKGLNELEQMKLIMSNYDGDLSNDLYLKRLQDWLLPYIERRSGDSEREKLLKDYLLYKSKDELDTCLKVVQLKLKLIQQQHAKQQQEQMQKDKNKKSFVGDASIDINLLVLNNFNLVEICCSCLYINESKEQLDICKRIIENLKTFSSDFKIAEVECHLKCCEIYQKYNVPDVKLMTLKESIENESNCKNFINLLASSSFKTKINEEYLNEVEKTFQFLHASLYKNLVSFQHFKEILVRNLLNSKHVENIRLAAKKIDELFQIDVNLAMKLCVESSQLYFNSSTSYYDSDMRLAQECLSIADSNIKKKAFNKHAFDSTNENNSNLKSLYQQEHDLIAAVKTINDFNLNNLLPIKIRSMENRFDIIKLILEKNASAYKDHDKLINLGKLLGLNRTNKNCEEIMLLICEHSLSKQNLQIALMMCKNLMKYNYEDAWKCTKELASHLLNSKPSTTTNTATNILASFKRLSSNIYNFNENEVYFNEISELLRFSITYCDNQSLEEILALQNEISNKLEFKKEEEEEDLEGGHIQEQIVRLDMTSADKTFEFDLESKNNDKVANLLSELVTYDKKDESDVSDAKFMKKLEKLTHLDLSVSLAYLLQLNIRNEIYYIELVINNTNLNQSSSYEFLLYIITLTILSKLKVKFSKLDDKQNSSLKSSLYTLSMSNLLEIIRKLRETINCTDDELVTKLFSLFTKVDNLCIEYIQLTELNNLNKGINISRFKNETAYRNDTINGLAMDINTFELACNLAKLNGLCLWDIYISFVEYLFNEYDDGEETKLKLIEEFIIKLKPELIKDKNKLVERVSKSITIDGQNIEKLILYYSLLAENDDLFEINLKLLKKIKQINFDNKLNYKSLLDEPIETLNLVLNESTLQFFTKNATSLSSVLNDKKIKLSPSRVYSIFYLKKFNDWLDESATITETFQINQQFDNLKDYLKKITAELDCMNLIYEVVMNRKTIIKLSLPQRKELLKRFMKLFKKAPEVKSTVQFSYEDVYNYLVRLQDHLKLIESLNGLLTNSESEYKLNIDDKLGKLVSPDHAEPDFEDLESLFVSMLLNGYSIEKLNQLLLLLKHNRLTIEEIVRNYFRKLFNLIESSKDKDEYIEELNKFLKILSTYLNKSSKGDSKMIISQEEVMRHVRLFCDNMKIELRVRLNLLEYIKTLFISINTNDLLLLIVYKTNAILETYGLSVKNINLEQISSEEVRILFFNTLYVSIKSREESIGLLSLLKIWPPFESIGEINRKTWNLALIQHIGFITPNDEIANFNLIALVRELKSEKQLNEYDVAHISSQILMEVRESSKPLNSNPDYKQIKRNNFKLFQVFKLCFLYQNFTIIKEIVDSIQFSIISEDGDENCFFNNESSDKLFFSDKKSDTENIELFLKNLINTRIYDLFIAYLIKNGTKERIEMIVKILKKNNYLIEASYLVSILNNIHSQYNTFALSFAILQKFH